MLTRRSPGWRKIELRHGTGLQDYLHHRLREVQVNGSSPSSQCFIEFLQADLSDRSLKVAMNESIEKFMKISRWLSFVTKVYIATYTKENVRLTKGIVGDYYKAGAQTSSQASKGPSKEIMLKSYNEWHIFFFFFFVDM